MKRWHPKSHSHRENLKVDAFISDIITVYAKHGLSISHEDIQGAFKIEKHSWDNQKWLEMAYDSTNLP